MPDALVSDAWNERELEQIRDGLIARVDGFFGHPTPIDHDGSGVPLSREPCLSTGNPADRR
jgi:hypothetical protein